MTRFRVLIPLGLLAFTAGAAGSIVLMNAGLAALLASTIFLATAEERKRAVWGLLPLLPWIGAFLVAFAANWGLPAKNLKFLFSWLSLPLLVAFLPSLDRKRILPVFFGVLAVASLLGLIQHLHGIGVLDTGLCSFKAKDYTGRGTQFLCGFKAGTRARGFFYTPMTFGAVLMFGILAYGVLLQSRQLSKRWAWLSPLYLLALLMTSTRNAWLGFLAAVPVILGRQARAWRWALAGAVLAGTVVAAAPTLRQRVLSIGTVNTDPNSSTGARLFLWKDALAQFQEKPIAGWGPGTFSRNVNERHPDVKLLSNKHAHSIYLQSLAETGIIGLLGMLTTAAWFVIRSLRAPPESRRIGLASVVAFLVAGFFEANYLDSEVLMNLLLWQAIAWCDTKQMPNA